MSVNNLASIYTLTFYGGRFRECGDKAVGPFSTLALFESFLPLLSSFDKVVALVVAVGCEDHDDGVHVVLDSAA